MTHPCMPPHLIVSLLVILFGPAARQARAQGCMAVRGSGHCSAGLADAAVPMTQTESDRWQASVGVRWFESDRHFSGSEELPVPPREAAVNNSTFLDLALHYQWSPRSSVALIIPFVYSVRTTSYEHDGINRYSTRAGGLADVRLSVYRWIFDPQHTPRGNLLLGIGPKFPTGDYDVRDTFYTSEGPVERGVDPSIQPGDGGYGFTVEAAGYLRLRDDLTGYAQGFYLVNPEDKNGTLTDIKRIISVTDQYLARAGLSLRAVPAWNLTCDLGLRIEGVPARDLIGASNGFRRPGYFISVEPGIGLARDAWSAALSVPIAVYRRRVRATWERERTGDAAFADVIISAHLTRRF